MQFSLRALFVLTTALAVTLWLVNWSPLVAAYVVMNSVLGALLAILVVAPWIGLTVCTQWLFQLLRGNRRVR
jgi:hypothetical protein